MNDETRRLPRISPTGAPWQGPPPALPPGEGLVRTGVKPRLRQAPPPRPELKYDRSQIAMAGIAAASVVAICSILAWFLAEVIP